MDKRFINDDYSKKAKVWIVVATHKAFEMPKDKMYIPLHVGAEGKFDDNGESLDFGFQKDNTGENISDMNNQFCELTGLYWAWKNLNARFIGLVHYRRHFKGVKTESGNTKGKAEIKSEFDKVLTYRQLKSLLQKYSVIVPKKRHYYIETLEKHYEHNHRIIELETAKEIMLEKYPDYEDAYNTAMGRTWGYMFNMMILRKDLMDEYCEWIFDILFELSKRLKNDNHVEDSSGNDRELTSFENRFPGRVSERLFNVWLEKQLESRRINKEDIFEIPFMYMEKINVFNKGLTFLRAKFTGKKPEKSF